MKFFESPEDQILVVTPKKTVISFSSQEIEANLIDDINKIPFHLKTTKLNVFGCLKEETKDINFALINYDSLSLSIVNSRNKNVAFPLLSRINEEDHFSNSLLHGSPVVINLGKWTSTHNTVIKNLINEKILKETKIDTHVIVKNISFVPSLYHWFKFLSFADPIEPKPTKSDIDENSKVTASQWNLLFDRVSIVCQDINNENKNTLERPHSILTFDSLWLANVQLSSVSSRVPIIFKNISLFVSKKSSYPPLLYDSFEKILKLQKYAKVAEIPNLKIFVLKTTSSLKTFINFDPLSEDDPNKCTVMLSTKSDTFKTMVDMFPGFSKKFLFLLTFDPSNKNDNKEPQNPPNKPPNKKEENQKIRQEPHILPPQSFKFSVTPKKESYKGIFLFLFLIVFCEFKI